MWRRTLLPILLAVAGAVATVASRVLASDFERQPLGVWIATWAGGGVSLAIGAVAMWNGVSATSERIQTDTFKALLVALAKVVDLTGVPAKDIGLGAYRVGRPFWRFWRVQQTRLTNVRLSNYPPPLVGWDCSKGVVGRCWKERQRIVRFVRSGADYCGCTEKEWLEVPEDERWGMDYEEWKDTQRYALIVAYPAQGDEKYKGCVSLDTTKDEHVAKLLDDEVLALLGDAAAAVAKSLGGA